MAGGRAPQRNIGAGILAFAPYLMKSLSIVGTAAMFMVGGSILAHGIPPLHHGIEAIAHHLKPFRRSAAFLAALTPTLLDALVGIVAGALVLMVVMLGTRVFRTAKA